MFTRLIIFFQEALVISLDFEFDNILELVEVELMVQCEEVYVLLEEELIHQVLEYQLQ